MNSTAIQSAITDQSLLSLLAEYELLEQLAKAQAEDLYVDSFELDMGEASITDQQAFDFLIHEINVSSPEQLTAWRHSHGLIEDAALLSYSRRLHKKNLVIQTLLKGTGESLFLRYKDRLDRVLYSLLRVDSEDLAYALYYAIDNGEIEFGDAAAAHSAGPESKTQGIIGPVDLTTPHPEVAARLRTASPRQLFPPFKAEEWFVIIRLEYRFDSEFDEKTQKFLGSLLLSAKSKDSATSLLDSYLPPTAVR